MVCVYSLYFFGLRKHGVVEVENLSNTTAGNNTCGHGGVRLSLCHAFINTHFMYHVMYHVSRYNKR